MKATDASNFFVCAGLTTGLLLSLADRSPAQTTTNTTVPVVTIRAPDPEASEPGANTGMFQLLREGPTNLALTVFMRIGGTASNGVDYAFIRHWTNIPAGVRVVPILVRPIDDTLFERSETVEACLFYPLSTVPINYQIGSPSNAVIFIYDNDPAPTNAPPIVTVRATDPQASEPGMLTVVDSGEFTITRSYGTNVPLTVRYSIAGTASNGVDYARITNFTVIPPGQLSARVMIYPRPDALPEPTETVVLRIEPPFCVTPVIPLPYECYQIGTPREAVVYIADSTLPTNRPPVVTVSAPDAVAAEGTNCVRWVGWACCPAPTNWCGTNTATFVVRRAGPTNDALTVYYQLGGTASNGVDYTELPGTVTISADRRAAEIKLVPIDDLLPERLETVVLRLRVPPDTSNAAPPYLIGLPGRAAAVIVDNDAPRPATALLPDRCFHIMRPGANGTSWRIEWSSNLTDWTPIGTTTVTDGAIHFVDPDAEDAPRRYYRAVPEPNPPAE